MKIIPAILEKDYESVKRRLDLYSKVATTIQIDVCDGVFTPHTTWLPVEYDKLNGYIINIEMDMMVSDIDQHLETLYLYDVKKIIVHTDNMDIAKYMMIYEEIKTHNSFIQVAICDNDVSKIENAFGYYDYVQLMGVSSIGEQGHEFDDSVLAKITTLKSFFDEKHLDTEMIIQIDGGMNPDTIKLCKEAGASSFAVGHLLKDYTDQNILQDVYTSLKSI